MNIIETIRNAKPGSYVDFRTADGQIDSVPIDDLRALLPVASTVIVQRFCKHGFKDGDKCPVCKGIPMFSDNVAQMVTRT